jgi:hypothetical protein
MMRLLTSWIVFAIATAAASPAAAQVTAVARVTATGAIVRVSPALDAAVVATPAIGSILDVSEVKDEWVVVLMPPTDAGLRRYGYILRRSVEVLSDKTIVPGQSTLPPSIARPPAASDPAAAPAALAPDWNGRLQNAKARKRAGQAKRWGGLGVVGAGAALVAVMTVKILDQGPNRKCTDANPCYEYAWGLGGAVGLMVTGGILSSRGSRQIAAANTDLIRLETERLNARTKIALIIPLSGQSGWEAAISTSPERLQASLRLRW